MTQSAHLLIWLPLFIFLARVTDMTLDTLRIIFVARGRRLLATSLGFLEILIWLFAISQVLQNLSYPLNAVAYAAGFALGNYVGMTIERRLAMGRVILRVITRKDSSVLIQALREAEFGMTLVPAEGRRGPVKILFSVIDRKDIHTFIETVKRHNPRAFVSVEDIREASEGQFPHHTPFGGFFLFRRPFARKGV